MPQRAREAGDAAREAEMDAARLGGVGAAEAEAERDAAEVERDAAEAEAGVGMAREAVREAAREAARERCWRK